MDIKWSREARSNFMKIISTSHCDLSKLENEDGDDFMGKVQSSEELMKYISTMDRDNSVIQFHIPGKGKFTLVLQEDEKSIEDDVRVNPQLGRMITESQEQYKQGLGMSTKELLKSMSIKDFK